jgi:4-hydroxy 2-oxovalerate aldolase
LNSKTIKILDCTLRDGGYYNDWDFDTEVVSKYLNAMSASSVDVVELGLRQVARNRYLGAHAYLPEFFLSKLDLPSNLRFAFMIDAKTILDE